MGPTAVLAIGSNAAPETLERKFAHFPAEKDRAVLALTGRLHDFDVGVAAQPTIYGSMPATLFPSSRTEVSATLLWVTPGQLTQLAWSEISYMLGKLRTRFSVDEGGESFDEVLRGRGPDRRDDGGDGEQGITAFRVGALDSLQPGWGAMTAGERSMAFATGRSSRPMHPRWPPARRDLE